MEVEKQELLKPLAEPQLNTDFSRTTCFSRLFFWWVFPQMKAFRTSPLTPEALMNLPDGFLFPTRKFQYSGRLATSLKKAYQWDVVVLGLQGVLISSLNFLLPLYIVYIQSFIDNSRPVWEGLLSLGIVALSMLLKSLLTSNQSLALIQLRVAIKSALQELIYSSSLHLKEGLSVGQSVNILQVDATRVYESVPWAVNLLYYPFHFAAAVALLCSLLGVAAAVGVAFFALLFVLNFYIEKAIQGINLKIMSAKDARMKHTTELLTNIRPLKMLAWEEAILSRVFAARKEESRIIRRYMQLRAASISSMLSAPALVAMVVLVTYVYIFGHQLTVSAAFGTLSTLFLLQIPLREFPSSLSNLNQALAATKRIDVTSIQAFLNREKVETRPSGPSQYAVLVSSGQFSYTNASPLVLSDLSLTVIPGEFVAVIGPVGSGKTSLLKAVMGEMHKSSGEMEVNGRVAYCGGSECWILNATVKDNIVVGREVDEGRYRRVVEACALGPDLQALPAGDNTEIGERGINLSGGQKARVALARGVYADADIYLLDDPLGAVDAHVRSHIFQQCFLGLLRGKTRLLVTHSVEYLSHVDRVVTVSNGRVEIVGKATDAVMQLSVAESGKAVGQSAGGRLVRDEDRPHGDVKWSVYLAYFRFSGGFLSIFFMLFLILIWVFSRVGADLSLKYWGETHSSVWTYTFVGLSCSAVTSIFVRTLMLSLTGVRAGNEVHNRAIAAVVKAPINLYFDVTPLGRLLNRFSKDVYDMDIDLPFNFGSVVATYASFLSILVVSVIYVPLIIFILPVLYWLAQKCQVYYLAGANNTNRMLRNASSPLVQHFTETLAGLKIIRSLELQKVSQETNTNYVSLSNKILFNHAAATIWLDLMLNSITVLYFLLVTSFLILNHESLSTGAIGLIISYMLPLPRSITMNTQFMSRLKTNMISMERVYQLGNVEGEAPRVREGDGSLELWPAVGGIEFRDVSLRYRPNTPVVLKGLSFRIEGGEKIGVVGRTGSGKSSLLQALFRTVELHRGQIVIDEVDISTIGLQKLRQSLTLIPQDPLLFKGSMRDNVDPFHRLTKEKVTSVLHAVNLHTFNCDSIVEENGGNLSSGERQLVCIARASVASTKILLMDEATSSVDLQTDETIHTLLRSNFAECTVLTIAHRIATILHSSRILVLSNGQLSEFDSPSVLLADPTSHFSQLVAELPKQQE